MIRFKEMVEEKVIRTKIRMVKVTDKVVEKLSENSGNFLEEALKYIIAIVIGGLFLGGLYLLFKNIIIPALSSKVEDMFNYSA